MTFHETVLNNLIKYRQNNPNFHFLPRQRNTKDRLNQGYWFQGDSGYAFVGIIDSSGGINKTRSVGLVFWEKDGRLEFSLEVVFKGEANKKLISVYEKITQEEEMQMKEPQKYYKNLGPTGENFEHVFKFLDTHHSKILDVFKQNDFENKLVTKTKCDKLLKNIEKYKNTLLDQPATSNEISKLLKEYIHTCKTTSLLDDELYKFQWALWLKENIDFKTQTDEEILALAEQSQDNQYSGSRGVQFIKKGARSVLSKFIGIEDIQYFRKFYNGEALKEIGFKERNMSFPIVSCWLSSFFPDKIYPISKTSFADLARVLFNANLNNSNISFLMGMQPYFKEVDDLLKANEEYKTLLKAKLNLENLSQLEFNWAAQDFFLFLDRNPSLFKNDNETNKDIMIDTPLNLILYGPPGTGKTYTTILEAAKIVEKTNEIDYDEALEVFNNKLESQIEFITFHQNYSYEDFIQGLRPDVTQDNLSFKRTDGLFTKIAVNALFEYYKVYQKNQREGIQNKTIDINEAYIEFLNHLERGQEFDTRTGQKVKINDFTDRQNIEFKPLKGTRPYLVSGNRLIKLYKAFPAIENIQRVSEDIRGAIGGCNASIYYVALREFISFLEDYSASEDILEDIENPDFKYEDITYTRKKELLASTDLSDLRTVSSSKVPNYVIIIDEINRANISRVFGELITLIEEDKRSHGKIPLKVTLPSGEKFIVPSNLYIIGTMNTADKSIALLDIALRRRFEFVPMYPKYEIDDNLVNENILLEKINLEIINRKGHDFTIGHSYFMGTEFSLENAINNKVIPLMLEYFMNDHIEVKKILTNCGILLSDQWPMKYAGINND